MAQYRTGTVAVTNNSTSVVGTGTAFLTNAVVGNTFKVAGINAIYQIIAVVSDTQITISPAYAGTTASTLTYQITRDFTPNLGLAELSPSDVDWTYHFNQEVVRKLDQLKASVPATATSSGKPGQWAASPTYFYIYTGDGTTHAWRRAALSSW